MRSSPRPLLLGFLLVTLVIGMACPHAWADTYADWRGRVFSTAEQANSAISGEGASPAGDGIANLTKYALNLDPHQDGSASLPRVTSDGTYLLLTYRVPPYATSDLHVVPEVSPDLRGWHRGVNAIGVYTTDYLPDGTTLRTVYALSPQNANPRLFLRLQILEGNVLPAYWQMQYFGHTGVDPLADADGDRISNFDEFLADTDPNDVYSPNPVLAIIGGNNQGGAVNQFVPAPLTVRVTNIHGLALLNVPVRFAVSGGGGQLSLTNDGQGLVATVDTRTNASGQAQVYYRQGASAPVTSTIIAQAVNQGRISGQVAFTESTANPPVITLLSPADGSTSSTSQVAVSIQVASDVPLDEVRINSILVQPADNAGHYQQNLTLPEGPQTVTLRARSTFGLVTFGQFTVTVAALPPDIAILQPADNQAFETANVLVKARADTNQGTVTINGVSATRSGYVYAAWLRLTATGFNTLTATLTDPAGRQTSNSVTVLFSPPPDYDPRDDPPPDDPNPFPPATITLDSPVDGLVITTQ